MGPFGTNQSQNVETVQTLYNLWVPLRPIIFKMSKLYKTVNTVQAVKPVVGVCCGGKQWFEMMSPNLTHGRTK